MSTEGTEQPQQVGEDARYEIVASEDRVNLTIQKHGSEVSIATDSNSAIQLATDILTGVNNAGTRR